MAVAGVGLVVITGAGDLVREWWLVCDGGWLVSSAVVVGAREMRGFYLELEAGNRGSKEIGEW